MAAFLDAPNRSLALQAGPAQLTDTPAPTSADVWRVMLIAAAMLMITMGGRQTLGLFIAPFDASTGLGVAAISFALAVSQFVWGAAQPLYGAFADAYGSRPVLIFGAVLLAVGTALTPFVHTTFGVIVTQGILCAAGAAAGSFSILIGSVSRLLPEHRRSFAAGFINAGSSMGQFLFAPLVQLLIGAFNWMFALWTLAASALLTIPLAYALTRGTNATARPQPAVAAPALGLSVQLKQALRERSYLLLHLGFFTCGFHIAFLVTHMPGQVQLCGLAASVSANAIALIGLFNIAGSLGAGWLCQRVRMKYVLAAMYGSRAVSIALFLLAPKTALTFYVFAAVLGMTWLATVPPTVGLVGKLFGPRYLATLFGLTLLSHQIGGFFGAWLGGLTIARFGDYGWMWYADIVLALLAALSNLPIREEVPVPHAASA